MEFSKKIFIIITVMTISVVIFACYMMWSLEDIGPLSLVIPAVFTEMGAATGFYYKKAGRENKAKIERSMKQDERAGKNV